MSVTIAAIRRTASEHVTVVLEDGREIPSTLGSLAEMRLFDGKTLDGEELSRLISSSALALAREKALVLLSYRPMSAKELRDKLVQKDVAPDRAAAAVEWLQDQRLLDDARYAEMVVRHYSGKGYGEGRIRSELSRRGVPRELWDEALEQMSDQDDALQRFIASRLKDPDDRAQVQKVSAALLRRGYPWEEVRTALARFRAELDEG
ncbi:MAG: regulatory protein RecX [Oscillospiraceae bacterium]|nr:regulatory protein RecX [Oscillospiraceae bacterium]